MIESGEVDHLVASLEKAVEGKVERGEPIARFTSFRLGGPALVFFEPVDSSDLESAAKVISGSDLPIVTIGRGTNLLVSDRGFRGVVIRLGEKFDWISSDGNSISAGASTALPQVANKAARLSLSGLEFSIAIPATVGGAVRMNAGAHGSSIADVLQYAVVCRLETGALEEMVSDELQLAYRKSALGDRDIVCSARFDLHPGDNTTILRTMASFRTHRSATQPIEAPNAGSMFRNPEGETAGRLIESAGLKGFKVGGAEVSKKHANFFLAHRSATAQDVFDLMSRVQQTVAEKSNVHLEPEVRLVGEFDRSDTLIRGGDRQQE